MHLYMIMHLKICAHNLLVIYFLDNEFNVYENILPNV